MMGIKRSSSSLGGVAGPLIVTLATRSLDPWGIFLTSAGLAVLAALLSLVVLHRDQA